MNNRYILIAVVLLFTFALTSCRGVISPSLAETPCAPQTIEVTRIIPQPTTTEGAIPSLSVSITAGSSSVQIDPAYFDGIVVLTRYYTLLEHGLYDEVLPMYSSSLSKRNGGKNFEVDIKSIKLSGIQPYNYWLAQQGQPLPPIPENEIRYVVYTTVIHKAPAWNVGGTPQPDRQTTFVSLILENGEWKLYELQSSPWFQ
jgi:hypothetical protein